MATECTPKDTKANRCKSAYSQNVTSQKNPNDNVRMDWNNPQNAVGYNTKTVATSSFIRRTAVTKYKTVTEKDKYGRDVTKKVADKTETRYNHPYVLASSDFHMDLPSNAFIWQVKFQVRMRITGKADVKAPVGDFRIATPRFSEKYTDTKGTTTGWYHGSYLYVPNEKLSTKFETYDYILPREDIKTGKFTYDKLNQNLMGLDLIWHNAKFDGTKDTSVDVQVEWIRCVIEYDVPDYQINITNPVTSPNSIINKATIVNGVPKYTTASNVAINSGNGTESSPYHTNGEFQVSVNVTNKSKSTGYARTVKVELPWGTELSSNTIAPTGYIASDGSFDKNTMTWTLPRKQDASYKLDLWLLPHKYGLAHVDATITQDNRSASYYYWKNEGWEDGYDSITVTANGTIRKYTKSCVSIDVRGVSYDNSLQINVATDKTVQDGVFTLSDESDDGISLDSQTSSSATLTVPEHEDFHAVLNYCFYPTATGDLTMTVTASDGGSGSQKFNVVDSYVYNLIPDPTSEYSARCEFHNHRVASRLTSDNVLVPFVVDDGDANMIMDDCSIGMSLFEDLDYIGCVPLEHLHFDPKSTFKDTLLNSTYKNKKYMGKKLAPDEDITLNVRLHPQQVTTIQGLIKMDKPIPINANHKCFEGDSLNHRGWCEIYGIKTELTNPRWYKCDIDVKYLTHNLNTRFKIHRSPKDDSLEIPSIMSETFSSGESLSDDNLDENIGESYFITDTDGTYYYAEDYVQDDEVVTFNDSERNNFNIDNGQHITVKSRNPLTSKSSVSFSWSSTLLEEYRENNISRIIRLLNKTGTVLFEYQYDDISIDEDEITAHIIYRVLEENNEMMDYNISKPLKFRYNANDYTSDVLDDDEELNVIATGEAHYGSTVTFKIENNILSIEDEGFNGREISQENIKLLDDDYYYQIEWINNNDDAETSSVDCVFDLEVQDTLLTSTYGDKFSNIVVSPFPVTDKKILFTRKGEEGTIYYYQDDSEEFSYLIDPYYQYMNGTDLVTSDGVSIFDLNYGYEVVYIQNGLVRLGFNRLTGYMYLGKYDPTSETYHTTHRFHLDKFDDINLNALNDDKIEIQASDSTFTIYRGHPYIKIKHELEDILIDTSFNRVYSEQLDTDLNDLPVYFDLMNDSNLLPECVSGGRELKSSCIEVSEVENPSKTPTSLSWVNFPQNIILDNEANLDTGEISANSVTFTLDSSTLSEYTEVISLDDTTCSFGDYTVSIESDKVPARFDIIQFQSPIQTGESSSINARIVDYNDYGVEGQTVNFYEEYDASRIDVGSDKSIIMVGESTNLVARVHDSDGSLVEGEYVVLSYDDNVDTSDWNISFTPSKLVTETGESMSFNVSVTDGNDNPVENVLCEVYGRTGGDVIPDTPKTVGSVSLTGDTSVLSAYDEDTVTLSATVLDEDANPMEGESVVFKQSSTTLGTVRTGSDGVAEYTYNSQGVGDVSFTASVGSLVSETYSLEDCWNAQISEVSAGSNTVNSIGMDTVHNVQNDDFCLIFDHKGNGNICIGATSEYSTPSTANYRLTLGSYNSKHYCAVRTNSTDESTCSSEDNNTYYTYKIEKKGNTVSFYVNDVLWLTKTATFFSSYSSYSIYNIKWGGGTDYMKNIRLKPL